MYCGALLDLIPQNRYTRPTAIYTASGTFFPPPIHVASWTFFSSDSKFSIWAFLFLCVVRAKPSLVVVASTNQDSKHPVLHLVIGLAADTRLHGAPEWAWTPTTLQTYIRSIHLAGGFVWMCVIYGLALCNTQTQTQRDRIFIHGIIIIMDKIKEN